MKGIDVSEHEGVIDWDRVKSQIDFAILRLGWIENNECKLDKQFERNYTECKRLKIPVGVYVFNYVKTPQRAKECASWVLGILQDKTLELPVYIDMENDENSAFKLSSLGKNILTAIVQAFNGVIESKGLWAGVYANLDWYNNYLYKDDLRKQYTTWIAHFDVNEDRYNGQYDILQFSKTGKVNGISDDVDLDVMYRDLISEIAGNVPQGTKTNEEIANEVIERLWGNADSTPTRKERITAAGYDYNAVQAIVNRKMAKTKYFPACLSKYSSLVDALKSLGIDSSYENRKRISKVNGINNYIGSSEQNIKMLRLLKAGKLRNY